MNKADTVTVLTYSNPRMLVDIPDWPSGAHKTRALFEIEVTPRGERACRTTWNPKTGAKNATKKLTYAGKMRFVDGSDGRLYIIEKSINYRFITVMRGTFDYQQEVIYESDDMERFKAVSKLFES